MGGVAGGIYGGAYKIGTSGRSSSYRSPWEIFQAARKTKTGKRIEEAVIQGITGGLTSGISAQVGGGIGGSVNNAYYSPGGAIGQAQAAQQDYLTAVPASQTAAQASSQGAFASEANTNRQFAIFQTGQQHAHERYLQAQALANGRDVDGPYTPKQIVDGLTNRIQSGPGVVRELIDRHRAQRQNYQYDRFKTIGQM